MSAALNATMRRRLDLAGEVVALADHMGIGISNLYLVAADIGVHTVDPADAPRLAGAIDGDPTVKGYGPFATWTGVHRGTDVVVYGPAAEAVAP